MNVRLVGFFWPNNQEEEAMRILGKRLTLILAVLVTPTIVFAQERMYEWGWGGHPMWWMWGAWGLGMLFVMVVFWGLVITGLVLGIRWLVRQGGGARSDSALDILRQRYARGEINKDEFEARKRDLSV